MLLVHSQLKKLTHLASETCSEPSCTGLCAEKVAHTWGLIICGCCLEILIIFSLKLAFWKCTCGICFIARRTKAGTWHLPLREVCTLYMLPPMSLSHPIHRSQEEEGMSRDVVSRVCGHRWDTW
ncbi:uncharacterized protein LOC128931694 isoform X3 [Callithrix jacchus]